MANKKYILGVFDDDEDVLHAVSDVREKGIKIHEVY